MVYARLMDISSCFYRRSNLNMTEKDDGEYEREWGMRMSNSPDKGPIELLKLAWERWRDNES